MPRAMALAPKAAPKFVMFEGLEAIAQLDRLVALADAGAFKVILSPESPLPFTLEGVTQAFKLQETRHTKGKVVVAVATS